MAIDGSSLDVADTEANVAHFGRVGSGPKASVFPKLQVMALAECGSHAMVAAVFGSARTGERTLAGDPDLIGRIEPGMLVFADTGLYSWGLFNSYAATGADLAWRIGASVSVGHLRWLSDGSYLALIFRPGWRPSGGLGWWRWASPAARCPRRWPGWCGSSSTRCPTVTPTVS
jgi:hypothetical protein